MVKEVIKSARCDWYYRVLEEGSVTQGDKIELLEREYPEWTIKRVFQLPIATNHNKSFLGISFSKKRTQKALRELSQVAALSDHRKQRAKQLT